jgi:hypothetical protein
MTDNVVRLRGSFGRGLRGDKTRHHACESDRVSRNERDHALPQWPLREHRAHNLPLPPHRYEQTNSREIPAAMGKGGRNCSEAGLMRNSSSVVGC